MVANMYSLDRDSNTTLEATFVYRRTKYFQLVLFLKQLHHTDNVVQQPPWKECDYPEIGNRPSFLITIHHTVELKYGVMAKLDPALLKTCQYSYKYRMISIIPK